MFQDEVKDLVLEASGKIRTLREGRAVKLEDIQDDPLLRVTRVEDKKYADHYLNTMRQRFLSVSGILMLMFNQGELLTSAQLIESIPIENGGRDTDYHSVLLLLQKSVSGHLLLT